MPGLREVARIVSDLHERKILNGDTTIREILNSFSGEFITPGEKAGWYAIGGDHYVIVCGLQQVSDAVNPAVSGTRF